MRYLLAILLLPAVAFAHTRTRTVYETKYVTNTVYVTEYVERVVTQKVETLIYTNAPSQPTVIGDYDGVNMDEQGGVMFPIFFKEGR